MCVAFSSVRDAVKPPSRRPSARDRTAALLTSAARAQLIDGGEMSVAAVAERAGVSRATAYRYFINNDAVTLWAAMPILTDTATPDAATGADDPAQAPARARPAARAEHLVRQRGEWAFDHERELRAVLATSLASESRAKGAFRQGKLRRSQWVEDSLLRYLPDYVTHDQRERLAAALTPLFGSDMVVWTADAAELTRDEALDVIAWTARSLVETTLAEARATKRRERGQGSATATRRG